ncbi:MAG TPA: NAD(+)/NADH kinase [Solirubrobacteraceae bacterium]|nr:NAD(+)/NADH kinase [Solirubrobacteraceae bacterium]
MSRASQITLFSHARPAETDDALRHLIARAQHHGATVRLDPDETRKHPSIASGPGVIADAEVSDDVSLAIALGGDGTILRALRRYAGTSVPVFGVNFGEIGFLSTIERDEAHDGFERALTGDFDTLTLPAIAVAHPGGPHLAINDVAITRRPGERVAELAYAIGGEEVGRVRCDGLVVATPAGSTGYNLANGGPVLAWGVEGYVVSFIAPHSLTARALVVAPEDVLAVHNRSHGAVDVSIDGRPAGGVGPGEAISVGFVREATDLALLPGSSFYRRLREKFGKLASSY